MNHRRQLLQVALAASLLLAAGCDTTRFYSQGVAGQWELLTAPRRMETVLRDPSTPPELAQRLRVVGEILDYAGTHLGLPAGAQYRAYADLGRSNVVWNVFAAPEFSTEPKQWWYPLYGRLSYRGYFREDTARRYAAALRARGFDAHVGGVPAYSSLGWFEDPVLNTFVFDDDADLAELLFHELSHQRLFFPGDTDFNEAFATAVAEVATQQWLEESGRTALLETYRRRLEHERAFRALALQIRSELSQAYAAGGGEAELRARKRAVLDSFERRYRELSADWTDDRRFDRWFETGVNNARLAALATYYEKVPAFLREIERHESLEDFFDAMRKLRRLSAEERIAALNAGGSPHSGE
jgi:predicted aminopeptidase